MNKFTSSSIQRTLFSKKRDIRIIYNDVHVFTCKILIRKISDLDLCQ